jgi:hypothetical protein
VVGACCPGPPLEPPRGSSDIKTATITTAASTQAAASQAGRALTAFSRWRARRGHPSSMVIGLVRTRVGNSSATRVRAGGEVVGGSCRILATSCADGLAAGSSVVIPVSRSGQPRGRAGGTRGAVDIGRSADRLPRVPARAPAPPGSHHRSAAPRRTRRQHRFQRRRRFATCSELATRDAATPGPWFVAARSGSGATHTAVMMPVILG